MTTKRERAIWALKTNALIVAFGAFAFGGAVAAANAHGEAKMELRLACVGNKTDLPDGSTLKIIDAGPFGLETATLHPSGELSFDDLGWDAYRTLAGGKQEEGGC